MSATAITKEELTLYAPVLQAIEAALREAPGPVIVAVDGRCAGGKTTFARKAAAFFDQCNVFHMDDFFLPPEKRTPQRLSTPGGNVDYERAARELFAPLLRGEPVSLRRFSCAEGAMTAPLEIPFRRLNLIEGSYSLHPALAGSSQLHVFFTCSPQVQLSRLERRETPESLERFKNRWIPMEERYFSAFDIEGKAHLTVDTSCVFC